MYQKKVQVSENERADEEQVNNMVRKVLYRKIMKQVSLVQIDNSRDHIAFWSRVIDFHASQGEQRFPKPMWS